MIERLEELDKNGEAFRLRRVVWWVEHGQLPASHTPPNQTEPQTRPNRKYQWAIRAQTLNQAHIINFPTHEEAERAIGAGRSWASNKGLATTIKRFSDTKFSITFNHKRKII